MTTIREFPDQIAASMALTYLRDNELDAELLDENASAWSRARLLVPIRLQVPEDQVETAQGLLAEFDKATPDLEEG